MSDAVGPVPVPKSDASRVPISVDRAVEEGILIATAALTMEVKNQIILDAVRDAQDYDPARVADAVRRDLAVLARQNDESSTRVQGIAADVLTPRGSYDREGYQAGDHEALASRAVIHARVSEELARLACDDAFIQDVAETARAEAWAEVGDAVQSRLIGNAPLVPDEHYEDDKDARLQAMLDINFRALEKRAKKLGLPPIHRDDGVPAPTPKRRFWQRRPQRG